MDPPPQDVLIVDDAVANVDKKKIHAIPLHRKCPKNIKHLKSTFGCLSDSVLNQDDDIKVVDRLLEIHDKEHDNKNTLTQPLDDDDNIVTIAKEDEVYEPYGYWKGRPKDPLEYRVPKPPVLSGQSCHASSPPMGAMLGGEGRYGSEVELRSLH